MGAECAAVEVLVCPCGAEGCCCCWCLWRRPLPFETAAPAGAADEGDDSDVDEADEVRLDGEVLEPASVLLLLLLLDGEDALLLLLWLPLPPPSRLLQNGGMLSHPAPAG